MKCPFWFFFFVILLLLLTVVSSQVNRQNASDNSSTIRRNSSLLSYINRALARTFASLEGNITGVPRVAVPRDYSLVYKICDQLRGTSDYERIGCCTPNDVRHLYNVKIYGNQLVVFSDVFQVNATKDWVLPWVRSVLPMRRSMDRLSITFVKGPMIPQIHCKEYFNGTLHFAGRSTVHNVYHALGDNFLPLAGQIILDYYLASDMLYAPRFILTDYQKKGYPEPLNKVRNRNFSVSSSPLASNNNSSSQTHYAPPRGSPRSSIPSQQHTRNKNKATMTTKSSTLLPESLHLRLMEDVMSEGALSLSQASGMCFRRVMWGHGPHMFYTAMLQRLRRLVSRFAREFAKELISYQALERNETIINPWPLENLYENTTIFRERKRQLLSQSSNDLSTKMQKQLLSKLNNTQKPLVNDRGEPLKVILFSRGTKNTPKSRSMENEQAVISALRARGAQAVICCDYRKTSIFQQLYNAINADVMIGLHGAALVHGVFMAPGSITIELKTLYAYESLLFPLISDAHSGIHAQVDVRDYYQRRRGGHLPMDESLVRRIVNMVDQTLQYRTTLRLRGESIRHKNIKELEIKMQGTNKVAPFSSAPSITSFLDPFFFQSRRISEEFSASMTSLINNMTSAQTIPVSSQSWVDASAVPVPIDYENTFLSEEYIPLACADTPNLASHNDSHNNSRSLRIMFNILSRVNFFGLNNVHLSDLINLSESNHSLLNNLSDNLFVQSRLWMLPMVVVPSDIYAYHFQEFISLSPVSLISILPAPTKSPAKSSFLANLFRSTSNQDPNKLRIEKKLEDKRNNIFSRIDSSSWVRHPEYHKLGDFIFPFLCSRDNIQPLYLASSSGNMIDAHVLGPQQHTHTQDCLQSAFQLWRLVLMDQSLTPVRSDSTVKTSPKLSSSSSSSSSHNKSKRSRSNNIINNVNNNNNNGMGTPSKRTPHSRATLPMHHNDDIDNIVPSNSIPLNLNQNHDHNVKNSPVMRPIKRKPNRPLAGRPPQPKLANVPRQVSIPTSSTSFASPAHRILHVQTPNNHNSNQFQNHNRSPTTNENNDNYVNKVGTKDSTINDKYRSVSPTSPLFLQPVLHLSASEYMQQLLYITDQQLQQEEEKAKRASNALTVEEDTGGVHCRMCETFGGS